MSYRDLDDTTFKIDRDYPTPKHGVYMPASHEWKHYTPEQKRKVVEVKKRMQSEPRLERHFTSGAPLTTEGLHALCAKVHELEERLEVADMELSESRKEIESLKAIIDV